MKTRPEGVSDSALVVALRDGWGVEAATIEHVPWGFGSHHWIATDAAGARWFVTLNDTSDLSMGPHQLRTAFTAARALRDAGLEFVAAPLPTVRGERGVFADLDDRYTASLFDFLDGDTTDEPLEVAALLPRLHDATDVVASIALREDFELPHRLELAAAIGDLDAEPWESGPFAEPARDLLETNLDFVTSLVAEYDSLVSRARSDALSDTRSSWVITHGETHPQNVMRTPDGLVLIDWDTARIAPRERDLWMLPREAHHAYEELTGRVVDADTLLLYQRWFELSEIGCYTALFRGPHVRDADTEESWENHLYFLAPQRRVAAAYDRLADTFGPWSDRVTPSFREHYIDVLRARLDSGARVLEMGCAAGVPVARALAETFDVTGIDVSPQMIESARANVPSMTFRVADMSHVEFEPASFDAVIALHSLIHVPRTKHAELFKRIARWLKPGGLFIASLGAHDLPAATEQDWLGGGEMYWSSFDAATNTRLLTAAGLTVEEAIVRDQIEPPNNPVQFLWVTCTRGA